MSTQFPEDPLNHIKTWQTKFKEHKQQCGVAEIDTPGTTKDSREKLHDTSHAIDHIENWREYWKDVLNASEDTFQEKVLAQVKKELSTHKQKTIDNFLDTICCALEEMNGDEVFDCFLEAVQSQHEYTKKEYDKTNELMDLLIGLK
jgi:hypothetical protein